MRTFSRSSSVLTSFFRNFARAWVLNFTLMLKFESRPRCNSWESYNLYGNSFSHRLSSSGSINSKKSVVSSYQENWALNIFLVILQPRYRLSYQFLKYGCTNRKNLKETRNSFKKWPLNLWWISNKAIIELENITKVVPKL